MCSIRHQAALAAGDFKDIGGIAALPGMPRAVLQSLDSVWRTDLNLALLAHEAARFHDLALIETRIRESIPPTHFLPRDLRDAAVKRADHARRLLGSITLAGIVEVDPVWRPLLTAIASVTDLSWDIPDGLDQPWFGGAIRKRAAPAPPTFPPKQAPIRRRRSWRRSDGPGNC